ncbi:MAG: class B sortase [Clostridia bacterium]|nr:class B sortase [Clostridia bacterium]
MRIELFSLRRSAEEVAEFDNHSKSIFSRLDADTTAHIILKTEVDRNPKKLAQTFASSLESDDTLDGYIFVNALDTKDSTSFVDLFTPLVGLLEEAMDCSQLYTEEGKEMVKHINVYSFPCKGTDIEGRCFYAIGKRFIVLPAFSGNDQVTIEDFISDAVMVANAKLKKKLEDYPQGIGTFENKELTYLKDKGKVKGFITSFLPSKGDRATDVIRKILVLLAIGAFIAGGIMLLNFYVFMPAGNRNVMTEIQNIAYDSTEDEVIIYATNDEGKIVEIKTVTNKNWKGLKKANDEIVAWIKIDNTKIDYPVLEHKGDTPEDQFYLYRNYKKDYSDFGSIFVDYRCEKSVDSKNLILHGHNMGSDDSMFGQLMNYARADGRTQGNTKFYQKNPTITIDTPKGMREYVIFSVMKIDVSNDIENVFDYLKAEFDSDARFMNFIYNIKLRSYLDVDVPINENDTLLTLSTCSYETDNMRTIVVARQVRENEDVSEYIKTAKKSSPVNVASSSFSLEYAAKNTPWYDGKGNLQGEEAVEYMAQSKMYTVQFLDAKGKVISTQIILEGRDAKAPKEDPRKASDGKYYYVFKGWDTVYLDVQKDLTVKPIFEKKKMSTPTKPTTKPTTVPDETEAPYEPPVEEEPVVTEAPETAPPTTAAPTTAPPTTAAPVTTLPPATTVAATEEATETPVTEISETQTTP